MTFSLPSVLMTNVNHMLNKLDELFVIINEFCPDIIALTETWLNENITNSVCNITGYSIVRHDRLHGSGGGILLYIKNDLQFKRLNEPLVANSNDFEILFVSIRPHILPRPLSIVIIVLLYCPPWYNADKCKQLCDFKLGFL